MQTKPFKTYGEQIEILESRNLKFSDKKNAEFILMNDSYYGLINGYKDLFILPKKTLKEEDDFDGNYFEDIKNLYDFDSELSSILYKYLLKIENTLKTSLSHHISKDIGYLQQEYLAPENYKPGEEVVNKTHTFEKQYSRDITLSIIEEKITKKVSKPIKFYTKEYNNVPPWIVVNSLSMGNLVHWYGVLKPITKTNIANDFLVKLEFMIEDDYKNVFTNSIKNAHHFRNIIAHGSRVYCSKSEFIIKEDVLMKYFDENTKFNYNYHIKYGCLFNILLQITILLSKRGTVRNRFINELEFAFIEYQTRSPKFYSKMMKQTRMPFEFINILKSVNVLSPVDFPKDIEIRG